MSDMEIQLGGVAPATEVVKRFSGLIWGPPGMGKTTLAMTMPGRIALLNFDPDGASSIPQSVLDEAGSKVFDFSTQSDSWYTRLKDSDAIGLEKVMDHFDSFVIDSLTAIVERTLARGIEVAKGATLERPSPGAYQARNNLAINFIRNTLRITGKYDKHVCFIAHEGPPQTNDDGALLGYTMALGGQLPAQAALRINECWPMFETGKNEKMIIVRKSRLRDPAKSRMFDARAMSEFAWKFDPVSWKGMRISDWWDDWQKGGFVKLPLPK